MLKTISVTLRKYTLVSSSNGQFNTRTQAILLWPQPAGPSADSGCARYKADETALHHLRYCSHYGAVRTRIWGKPFLHPREVLHITVRDLFEVFNILTRFS